MGTDRNDFKQNYHNYVGIIPGPDEPPSNPARVVERNPTQPRVRAALLAVATDLPAMRKITQFLGHKADFGCSRCKFQAEREPGTVGASGKMSYYTSTSITARTHEEVLPHEQKPHVSHRRMG